MRLKRGGKVGACELDFVMPHDLSRCAEHKGCRPELDSQQVRPRLVVVRKDQAIRGLDPRKLIRWEHDKDCSRGVGAFALAQGLRQGFQISGRLVGEMNDEVGTAPGPWRSPR